MAIINGENLRSPNRCKFLMTALEKGISGSTIAVITSTMAQKSEKEKEDIALKLLNIVETSDTEEEIMDKAEILEQELMSKETQK